MKSPREILLKQHSAQTSALDEIREQVVAEQRRTGILPVTERTARNELAHESSATIAAGDVAPITSGDLRERDVKARLASAGDRLEACPTMLATLRAWASFNRIASGSFAIAWLAIVALNIAANREESPSVAVRSTVEPSDAGVRWQDYRAELATLLLEETSTDDSSSDAIDRVPGPQSGVPGFRRFSQLTSTTYA